MNLFLYPRNVTVLIDLNGKRFFCPVKQNYSLTLSWLFLHSYRTRKLHDVVNLLLILIILRSKCVSLMQTIVSQSPAYMCLEIGV